MTDEKMLELAQRAGAFVDIDGFPPKRWADMSEDHLRKFAALVRREALEEVLDLAEHMHARNNNLRVIVSDMGSMMVRMVAGIEHLAEIARLWEPDHSSGADRAGWARAQDAKNDAMKLLADLPARITANATQQECTDAIRAAMEDDK